MFDKRIKKMEKELRRIEYETKDSIWKLNNPPEFKHGDECSYTDGDYKVDLVTVLEVQGIHVRHEYNWWKSPVRKYYVSYGGTDCIGKSIDILDGNKLELIHR